MMTYMKVISKHLHQRTEENYEKITVRIAGHQDEN